MKRKQNPVENGIHPEHRARQPSHAKTKPCPHATEGCVMNNANTWGSPPKGAQVEVEDGASTYVLWQPSFHRFSHTSSPASPDMCMYTFLTHQRSTAMWLLGKFSPLKRYQRQMFRGLQDLQICSPKSVLGKMTVLLLGCTLCFWKPQCPPQIKAACCWNTGPPMKMPFNNVKPLMRKHRQKESQPLMAAFLGFE